MLVNQSSSSNASLHPSSLSSHTTVYSLLSSCMTSTFGTLTVNVFTITSVVFLLPLCIFVLFQAVQRWQQQRPGMMMSHSDVFTYHMVIMELISVAGITVICSGIHANLEQLMMVGMCLCSINISGRMYFHVLTCVERYLAVVHPVTYLSLKKERGIRIRNIIISCVWLLSFATTGLLFLNDILSIAITSIHTLAIVLIVVSFCSLSVLCVLIRPGPGEGGGGRQRADRSKLRAFYTIMAILGVLLLKFCGNIVTVTVLATPELEETSRCAVWLVDICLSVPSSLVLPLLFLQRAGKLLCCKNNNGSGQGSD